MRKGIVGLWSGHGLLRGWARLPSTPQWHFWSLGRSPAVPELVGTGRPRALDRMAGLAPAYGPARIVSASIFRASIRLLLPLIMPASNCSSCRPADLGVRLEILSRDEDLDCISYMAAHYVAPGSSRRRADRKYKVAMDPLQTLLSFALLLRVTSSSNIVVLSPICTDSVPS